jgi:hypothetical protein
MKGNKWIPSTKRGRDRNFSILSQTKSTKLKKIITMILDNLLSYIFAQ